MATAKEYTMEELNYFRACKIITRIIPNCLRTVFKQEWNNNHKATHGEWLDTAKNGIDFYGMESPRSRKRNSRELNKLRNGKTLEWDCSSLFLGILYSKSVGASLNSAVKKNVDNLRQFRNQVLHAPDGTLTDVDFQTSLKTVISAFTNLKLDTSAIEEIKNQKTFPTEELRDIQQQLEQEKKRNEEPQPFCVLPPKPSHEIIKRTDEIKRIREKMKKLSRSKTNEITVAYLSGNPGCGKSEMARQIGDGVYNDVSVKDTEAKFVFTLDASILDTLIQSYMDFAYRLRCDENSTTSIGTSKDLTKEDKLAQLKSLIFPKFQKYSSWLLIVDNVTDIKSVSRYLPLAGEKTKGNGQMLITTQDSQSISLDSYTYHTSLSPGMKKDEAIKALSKISDFVSDSDEEIKLQVAKALDFQPLALACAGTYMRRVSSKGLSISWEKYLQKLQEGQREATEAEFEKSNLAYPKSMTSAVRMTVLREMSDGGIVMHALQYLSMMSPEPIPLEYVTQYVKKCKPNDDKELVAAEISSSSIILFSEDESKEIRLHQVVYSCLQKPIIRDAKGVDLFINVISSFSSVLDILNNDNFYDHTATTRSLVIHFNNLAKQLDSYAGNPPSSLVEKCCKRENIEIPSFLLWMGRICINHGKNEASRTYLKMSSKIQEKIRESTTSNNQLQILSSNLAKTLSSLGESLNALGQYKEAKGHFERALSIQEKLGNKDNQALIDILTGQGNTFLHLGQYEKAKSYHEKALSLNEAAYGPNHPNSVTTLSSLGSSYLYLRRYKEGKECYKRVLLIEEMAYSQNHPPLAISLNNMGCSLKDIGQNEEALKYFERAIDIQETAYGKHHPALAITLSNMGSSLYNLGQYIKGREYFERALDIKRKVYDAKHPFLAQALGNLGCCLMSLGKNKEAQEYLERALDIETTAYGENHPKVAIRLYSIGINLKRLLKYGEAEKYFKKALAVQEMVCDQNHPSVLSDTLLSFGDCLMSLRKYEEAKSCLVKSLSIQEKIYGKNHQRSDVTLSKLQACLKKLELNDKATK